MSPLSDSSPERDAAIEAMLPLIASGAGWNKATLRRALLRSGGVADDAAFLFPGGALEMIEAYCDLADRRMAAAFEPAPQEERTHERVRRLIALRLSQARHERPAVRQALALLALPRNNRVALRTLARTADAIWHAAGDQSADFSWYTKRALLAGIYSATLLFWLRDHSEGEAATLGFLDRRLADIGRITSLRRRFRFS